MRKPSVWQRKRSSGPALVAGLLGFILVSPLPAQEVSSRPDLGLDSLLSTTVSTAAKYNQTIRQVSGAVTIVTEEDIRRFGYRTLEDVLHALPGIYTSYDRNYTSVGVRGFGRPTDFNNRILLLINGHTTNESMWGSAMLGDDLVLNLRNVTRIEVVRGPSSALYGTGAMFAVINVMTRQPEGVTAGRVDLETGTFGKRAASGIVEFPLGANGGVALSGIIEGYDGHDLFYPEFSSPATNNGISHNLDWQNRDGVMLSARLGELSLQGRFTSRRKGTPTGSYGTIFNDPAARVRDDNGYAELTYQHQLSDVRQLTVRTYYDDYAYHGVYPYPGDLNTDRATNRVLGVETAFQWDPVASNRLTVGAEFRRNLKAEYLIPDNPRGPYTTKISQPFSVASIYLQDDFQLRTNLSLLAGIRHDDNSLTGGATTPRVALIFDPRPGTTLKAMYGRAFRAPSLYEAQFVSAGVPGNLGPERLGMSELILIQRLSGQLLLTGSLYHYVVRGLIDVVTDSSDAILAYRNLNRAHATGMEASLDARLGGGVTAYLNYSYQRATAGAGDSTASTLTNSPAHLAKLGIAADVTRQGSAALELRYESGRRTVEDTETNAFLLANLNLLAHPFAAAGEGERHLRDIDVSLSILNLFETRYEYPGGVEHLQPAIRQDGRTLLLRIGYAF